MLKKAMIEGLSVESGVKLWETLIRPTLEYAAEVWSGGDWPEAEHSQIGIQHSGVIRRHVADRPLGESLAG